MLHVIRGVTHEGGATTGWFVLLIMDEAVELSDDYAWRTGNYMLKIKIMSKI